MHMYVAPMCFIGLPRPEDEMSAVERLLDGDGGLAEGEGGGGVMLRRKKGDTEKVRKLAKRLSKDVEQLKKENEEYST